MDAETGSVALQPASQAASQAASRLDDVEVKSIKTLASLEETREKAASRLSVSVYSVVIVCEISNLHSVCTWATGNRVLFLLHKDSICGMWPKWAKEHSAVWFLFGFESDRELGVNVEPKAKLVFGFWIYMYTEISQFFSHCFRVLAHQAVKIWW